MPGPLDRVWPDVSRIGRDGGHVEDLSFGSEIKPIRRFYYGIDRPTSFRWASPAERHTQRPGPLRDLHVTECEQRPQLAASRGSASAAAAPRTRPDSALTLRTP